MKAQSTQYLHVHCNQKNLPNAWQIVDNYTLLLFLACNNNFKKLLI